MRKAAKPRPKYWGLKGTLHGIKFESGLEKKFIQICRQLGIKLQRCLKRVPYVENGKARTYYPDFIWVDLDFVIEIKGSWAFRENSGFVREKYSAAMDHLGGRYTVLTETELSSDFVIRLYRQLLEKYNVDCSKP